MDPAGPLRTSMPPSRCLPSSHIRNRLLQVRLVSRHSSFQSRGYVPVMAISRDHVSIMCCNDQYFPAPLALLPAVHLFRSRRLECSTVPARRRQILIAQDHSRHSPASRRGLAVLLEDTHFHLQEPCISISSCSIHSSVQR